ncbi:MAG: hypothetical protein HQK76_12915 [Desulfobacterales bacterium]|nr:hypothetical protein [Desulfobacterales bacterium]
MKCTKCKSNLSNDFFNTHQFSICPICNSALMVYTFPAFYDNNLQSNSEHVIIDSHRASCYFHPKKEAEITCSSCGRFLCKLCRIDLNGNNLCIACLESIKNKKKMDVLENHRTIYSKVALGLAVLPMLFVFPTLITAPMSIFVSIRYWKHPSSLVRKSKLGFVLAILISSLQLLGWALLFLLK